MEQPNINAVSLKLPEFWESAATVWFAQAEAQFTIRQISADDTKYCYVVAALGSSTASRLVSFLVNPPAHGKYEAIKAQLLNTFELSDAERANRLFSLNGLGDGKPSELMDKMLSLLGAHKSDFMFVQLFLRQLPSQVRAALANTDTTDCRALAAEADKFFLAGQQHCAAALIPVQPSLPPTPEATLAAAIPPPARRLDTTRRENSDLCWYHTKFGAKAKKCIPPCNFNVSGNARAGAR